MRTNFSSRMESFQNTATQLLANEITNTDVKIAKLEIPFENHFGTRENVKAVTTEGVDFPWNKYKCPHCPKSFETEKGFKQHYSAIHCSERKIHQCQACGKSYTEPTSLSRHRRKNPDCRTMSMKRSHEECSDTDSNEAPKRFKSLFNVVLRLNHVSRVVQPLPEVPFRTYYVATSNGTIRSIMKIIPEPTNSEGEEDDCCIPKRHISVISNSKNIYFGIRSIN